MRLLAKLKQKINGLKKLRKIGEKPNFSFCDFHLIEKPEGYNVENLFKHPKTGKIMPRILIRSDAREQVQSYTEWQAQPRDEFLYDDPKKTIKTHIDYVLAREFNAIVHPVRKREDVHFGGKISIIGNYAEIKINLPTPLDYVHRCVYPVAMASINLTNFKIERFRLTSEGNAYTDAKQFLIRQQADKLVSNINKFLKELFAKQKFSKNLELSFVTYKKTDEYPDTDESAPEFYDLLEEAK